MQHHGRKRKLRVALFVSLVLTLILGSTSLAQYPGYSWVTAYQVVNMGQGNADIVVNYYDSNGNQIAAAQKVFQDVPPGASRLVVQYTDDPNLPSGRHSVVISADQPIGAIVNQQLIANNATSYTPEPPFSTYSGASAGETKVVLPAVMYNWYGYFTEFFIMNAGTGAAQNVDITYTPGKIGGEPTGAAGVTDNDNQIPLYASITKSQESMSQLGAPSGTFKGRFLGSATIESDEPVVVVVNQHNPSQFKLMTYNGFDSNSTATEILIPTHMRNYFGYYTTLLVANPSSTETATVQLTYTPQETAPGQNYNECTPSPCQPVTVTHQIGPNEALTRYDGPPATDEQSDLDDNVNYSRFYGSVKVSSNIPVVAQINVEAVSGADKPAQAGSFNGIATSSASKEIVVPVVLADFYGYYTTLIVQNATSTAGTCDVTYTSDTTYSSVKGQSKTYTHNLPANGAFTVYEGRSGGVQIGDINSDSFWSDGTNRYFIGAARIKCTVDAVAFVNEESDINGKDSMYTMNTFNIK